VPSTASAIALGHLAAHVEQLAVLDELTEDTAHSQALKRLERAFADVRGWRGFVHPPVVAGCHVSLSLR
jgi:hypothetical protein